ncbi:MAG: hypothetical protein N0C81_05745 [Candidatus Thiodiazotropha lotti]|uniref:CBM-cenC domain-containing protein n=1 Tax=Candidatus Thiodiazotropha lotti TaxID=2792787 RepID=A0A9E4K8M8_9GAMM|nr:hypothetical protein [Candidatus Thiodiazotropha lotti]MCG7920815.1 hypothetical protein [Candidatus Thiodiazotropha lotti]MCG7929979.1 hypothetical protein [Candidatus Thiodiazotropha lotti]MCG7940883.1 hypothetical protein [Candidatus Thiodiazotropha lotti]MCG7989205.1 hypothetical protein [Candidatus Thiodiazotropha lotti]
MFYLFLMVTVSLMLSACSGENQLAEQGPPPQQQSQSAQSISLPLKNPSFEQSDQFVKGWGFSQHAGEPAYEVSIDTSDSTDGKHSYRIERKLVQAWGMINQWLPLDSAVGKSVKLSAMIKSEALGAKGFDISLVFRKANKKFISEISSEIVTGSHEWQRIEVTAVVPAKAAHLQITAVLNDAGTAWLDDVQLTLFDKQ